MAKRKKQPTAPHPPLAAEDSNPPDHAQTPVSPSRANGPDSGRFADEQIVLPLRQEHLQADKQWLEAGAIVVRKTVESRTETLPVEAAYEEVQVERVPVGRVLAEGESAAPRQEGATLIIPLVEEEIVVLKRRVVREELRLTKQRLMRQQVVQDVLRREDIQIAADGNIEIVPDGGSPAQPAD